MTKYEIKFSIFQGLGRRSRHLSQKFWATEGLGGLHASLLSYSRLGSVRVHIWPSTPLQVPASSKAKENSTISLLCVCWGNPLPTIRWEKYSDSGDGWISPIDLVPDVNKGSGQVNSSLPIYATHSNFRNLFRCVCSNAFDNKTSDPALLLFTCTGLLSFIVLDVLNKSKNVCIVAKYLIIMSSMNSLLSTRIPPFICGKESSPWICNRKHSGNLISFENISLWIIMLLLHFTLNTARKIQLRWKIFLNNIFVHK